MGIRYRKSINLGGGFRINISKSGIGYSWGTKGYRYTKTARGTTRKTYSIPGTGISYVEESGGKGANTPQQQASASNKVSIENVNISNYQSAEYGELLSHIRKAKRLDRLSNWLIATIVLVALAFPVFLVSAIIGLIFKIVIRKKMKVPMVYSFDEESSTAYENLSAMWMSLNQNQRFWQNISETKLDKKTSGGASRGITRIPTHAISKLPFFIESNVQVFGLKLRKQSVYFMPDKILVISKKDVGAINYSDIDMDFGTTRFVEEDAVPGDAKVIDYTWLKVNKNGTPDKRFKNNRQVPICEYGRVNIQSSLGLQIELMCSNSKTVTDMREFAAQIDAFNK